jgi:hypothetical protein
MCGIIAARPKEDERPSGRDRALRWWYGLAAAADSAGGAECGLADLMEYRGRVTCV